MALKFIAVWILNVLADTTCRMEKQKRCGQNSGLRSFIYKANTNTRTRSPNLLSLNNNTCSRTGPLAVGRKALSVWHRGGGGESLRQAKFQSSRGGDKCRG